MAQYRLSHLDSLETEAIHLFRETVAESEKPVLLFSGGKDSVVLARLAQKAFYPADIPFPFLQIDTGHNFPEVSGFIPRHIMELKGKLIVRNVADYLARENLPDPFERGETRNPLQGPTLLDAITEFNFTACFGGGRRDEDKARAKERFVSPRDEFGQWNPRNQPLEFMNLFNFRVSKGGNLRVFPMSNWTELDVWEYIQRENLSLPSIYFAHNRECYERGGKLVGVSQYILPKRGEVSKEYKVRYRTVGDVTCTAAVISGADTTEEVIEEVKSAKVSERGQTRLDDGNKSMEDRKDKGYF